MLNNSVETKEERSIELTCRLCLMDRDHYQPIFEFEGDKTISDWINDLTSLEIIQVPETPASLCRECKTTLETFGAFRISCFRNDQLYKEMFLECDSKEKPQIENASEVEESTVKEEPALVEEKVVIPEENVQDTSKEEIELILYIDEQQNNQKPALETIFEGSGPASSGKSLCTICNKYVSRLSQHRLIHEETRRFQCEFCSRGFNQLSNLRKHVRTHTKEKPYGCNYCDKGFTNSTELKVHQRIHTQERPFRCEECGKAFTTSGHLSRHSRSHSGAKPYSCEVCTVQFSTSSHLVRHRRLHSLEYPYSCSACDERFMRTEYLKAHRCKLQE